MVATHELTLLQDIAEAAHADIRAIEAIVTLSNKNGAIFRGVRSEAEWQSHSRLGIQANGGDGQASFWTTGLRIFSASEEHLQQYDTTFFHYAPGKKGVTPRMYVAAAKAKNIGVPAEKNSLVCVHRNLIYREFERLEVVGEVWDSYTSLYPVMIEYILNYSN